MAEPVVLRVPDMVCQGCADALTAAVQQVAPQAQVEIDLASKQVQVSSSTDQESIMAAIRAAGYSIE